LLLNQINFLTVILIFSQFNNIMELGGYTNIVYVSLDIEQGDEYIVISYNSDLKKTWLGFR